MCKLLFKFLFRQITAVCLGERQTVFIYIIAVRALDFFNLMAAASDKRDHIDPENILHAASRDRAVVFLGENVQLIGERGRRSPGINRLLAGRNDVYTARNALFNLFVNIPDKTEQRYDSDVRVTFVENLIRVFRNLNPRFYAKLRKVADVHAQNFGIYVDSPYNFRPFCVQITQNVLGHFAASVLYYSDSFHGIAP